MKEFMMIFVGGDYETQELSPEQLQERLMKWNTWLEELRKDDLFLDGRALKNPSRKVEGQERLVTDGAFVEVKELVTGYFLLKAKDLDHATELTKGFPDYDLGGRVEIREIENFTE